VFLDSVDRVNADRLTLAFGLVIRDARLATGWTQEQLAQRAAVHRTYIGDLEHGRKSPTLDVVDAIAGALGRAPHELVASAEQRLRAQSAQASKASQDRAALHSRQPSKTRHRKS
jgi:transcriptional regulator with XRE-family HTH domain